MVVGINGACAGAGLGLAASATDRLEDTLAREAELQLRLGRTADHSEAVEAFLAGRAPRFTGR